MRRLFSILTLVMACCVVCMAQPYRVLKVGGKAPTLKSKRQVVSESMILENAKVLLWPNAKGSYLKVYDAKGRNIVYLTAKGSSRNLSELVGSGHLSCRSSLRDTGFYPSDVICDAAGSVPAEFNYTRNGIEPAYFDLDRSLDVEDGDMVYVSFNDDGVRKFLKMKVVRQSNGVCRVLMDKNAFPQLPVSPSGRRSGFYISLYLVHDNNYSLLRDKCIFWH